MADQEASSSKGTLLEGSFMSLSVAARPVSPLQGTEGFGELVPFILRRGNIHLSVLPGISIAHTCKQCLTAMRSRRGCTSQPFL